MTKSESVSIPVSWQIDERLVITMRCAAGAGHEPPCELGFVAVSRRSAAKDLEACQRLHPHAALEEFATTNDTL